MIIDVSGILKEIGGKVPLDGEVTLNDADFLGELYSFKEPVKIKGSISNNGESLVFKAECDAVIGTHCARCLKDIDVNVHFKVDEDLAQDGEYEAGDEDIILFEGHTVPIDDIVLNSFLMNTSARYLCREDCKGLCQSCGADLNEGECGCNHETIDPRWSGLIDIMNKEK